MSEGEREKKEEKSFCFFLFSLAPAELLSKKNT